MDKGCILVTGASRGIGAAIAEALALDGFTVACLSRSGALPTREISDPDVRARFVTTECDVTRHDSVKQAIEDTMRRVGLPLVGLVNNAGLHLEDDAASQSIAEFEQVMSMNTTSVFMASQIAYPYLRDAGGATIVNIGSFFDKLGVRRNSAYCASKAAVGAISRCLAVEWASDGIRVHNVAPGYIATDLNKASLSSGSLSRFLAKRIPTGAPGASEDVAQLVRLLFTVTTGFMTGETIYLDGGQGMAL
ncbi:SDR family NAD(P)-dependent oxidoreductase [Pandoraea terrigena]|uniref:3-ketoacyl-ACP reductase n=1 Tax=Pandoraea terrigena TaxID=2508292 RepID=A0A5E4SSM3_9BURK|nr:SDR family oxidoreductase [Pandoraea terrigena]VVD77843.1 3-ketoacyl-ACP reductase [Pandoraea terrigena]